MGQERKEIAIPGAGPAPNGRAPEHAEVRCVLLHAKRSAPDRPAAPHELLESLARRSVRVSLCDNIYAALAELCANRSTASGGGGAALLIVEPAQACTPKSLERLLRATEKHVPGATLWRYEKDATPQLATFEPPPAPEPEVVIPPRSPARPTPSLRIAPDSVHAPTPPAPDADGSRDERPSGEPGVSTETDAAPETPGGGGRFSVVLTDEELAMLLADDAPGQSGGRA